MTDTTKGGTDSPSKKTSPKRAAKKTPSRPQSSTHEKTEVVLGDLRRGVTDSESVRVLQKKLKVTTTGTWDDATQAAVRVWQNEHGFVGGRGLRLNAQQAARLLGSSVTFVDSH